MPYKDEGSQHGSYRFIDDPIIGQQPFKWLKFGIEGSERGLVRVENLGHCFLERTQMILNLRLQAGHDLQIVPMIVKCWNMSQSDTSTSGLIVVAASS